MTPQEGDPRAVRLSGNQRLVWLVQRIVPDDPVYCEAIEGRIVSEADPHALRQVCQWLVDRHAALRTTFRLRDGAPEQVAHDAVPVPFRLHHAQDWTADEVAWHVDREVRRPFDLERGPLMRAHLFLRAPGQHRLLLSFHHIAADFYSLMLILQDVRALYPIAVAGGVAPPAPPAQYRDFVRWQEQLLGSHEGAQQLEHWASILAAAPLPMRLPFDRPIGERSGFSGCTHQFGLGAPLTSRLHACASRVPATMNAVLLAGFQAVLHAWTARPRFAVRITLTGRSEPDFATVVGHFANTLPIYADFSDDPAFSVAVERATRSVASAADHQDIPLAVLAERLRKIGCPTTALRSDTMFRFQIPHRFRTELRDQQMPAAVDLSRAPDGGTKLDLGGLIVELRNPVRSVAYHPIDLEMVEAGGEVAGYLHYWPDVFDQSTIVRFAEDYVRLLEEAANDPQRRVSSFAARGVAGSVGDEPRASGGGQQPVPVRRPTATEERIARIWASVLSVRTVHPGECFRDLGGDSLAAVESAARIAAEFGREIALPMLMGSPTLAELAAHIDAMVTGRPPG